MKVEDFRENLKEKKESSVSHGEILKKIWKHLDLGVIDREHPFHTPVFGTVEDNLPSMRTVVLRRFWRKPARLAFHAHKESPKIAQIGKNPNVCWLFYHPQEKFQLRISGIAEVHLADELTEEQWLAAELFSRRCYMGVAPGIEAEKAVPGFPEELIDRKPSPAESEKGRKNFAVVTSTVNSIDCYELHVRGHRRSLFAWENGELKTKWLTP